MSDIDPVKMAFGLVLILFLIMCWLASLFVRGIGPFWLDDEPEEDQCSESNPDRVSSEKGTIYGNTVKGSDDCGGIKY